MKGDFSRRTFDKTKHYNAVLMQQGRVQSDADWNEQEEINRHRIETGTRDTIGGCGAPRDNPGFGFLPLPDGADVRITPGRFYVDGILCELEPGSVVAAGFPREDPRLVQVARWTVDGREFRVGEWVCVRGEESSAGQFARIIAVAAAEQVLKLDRDISEIPANRHVLLARVVSYLTQPDYPEPALATDDHLPAINAKPGVYVAYLDVWRRHVTALDDERIREKALGGPDTCSRAQTVWQVKLWKAEDAGDVRQLRELADVALAAFIEAAGENRKAQTFAKKLKKQLASYLKLSDEAIIRGIIVRPEQWPTAFRGVEKAAQEFGFQGALAKRLLAASEQTLEQVKRLGREITCQTEFLGWQDEIAPGTGRLNARTQPSEKEELCLLPPSAGYQRLENQLYRIEIHQGGRLGKDKVTFKWSRDNGSVVTAIEALGASDVTVRDLGRDEVLGFAGGQLAEITDDRLELGAKPGQLVHLKQPDTATRKIPTMEAVTPLAGGAGGIDPARHPKLRRWDCADELNVEIPDANDGWIELEGGIQVKFSDGDYKTGDYWLIPARTATGEIEWPPYEVPNNAPLPQPPLGIKHHYCRLAVIRVPATRERSGKELENLKSTGPTFIDCRRIFPPLALHVTSINWRNDDFLAWTDFTKDGLQMVLDGPPEDFTVQPETVIVTAEIAFGRSGTIYIEPTASDAKTEGDGKPEIGKLFNPAASAAVEPGNGIFAVSIILGGRVSLTRNDDGTATILWRPVPNLMSMVNQLAKARYGKTGILPTFRLRVVLKGHDIWNTVNGRRIYLDGQAFGREGLNAADRPCTALCLPSGYSDRASDFESWLWLGGKAGAQFKVKSARLFSLENNRALDQMDAKYKERLIAKYGELVGCVDVQFTSAPEISTIKLGKTFQVLGVNGGQVPGEVSLLSGTTDTVRFLHGRKIFAAGEYQVTLTGGIKSADGAALDGEPTQLPSGDGTPGGEFSFSIVIA